MTTDSFHKVMKIILIAVFFSVVMAGCSDDGKVNSLRSELDGNARRLESLVSEQKELTTLVQKQQQTLLTLSERLDAMESATDEIEVFRKRIEGAKPSVEALPRIRNGHKEDLVSSSDGMILYDKGAEVNWGNLTISSPSGAMVSDAEQEVFGGDLKIVSGQNTLEAEGAILERRGDRLVLTASKVIRRQKNDSEPAPTQSVDTPPTGAPP